MSRNWARVVPRKSAGALVLLALAGTLAGCGGGSRQFAGANATAAPPASTVLLTVNGEPVTADELNVYINILTGGDPVAKIRLTAAQRYELAQELMRATLAAQEAEKLGLEKTPDTQANLAVTRMLYLAGKATEHFERTAKVSDSTLREMYRKKVKELNGNEYKLQRITLKSKAQAEKVISKLEGGGDFAALAKKYSIDSAAKRGGELDWIKQNALRKKNPEVFDAVAGLKEGAYTRAPIETSSGWLIIQLDQKTTVTSPEFAQLKPLLEKQAKGEAADRYIKKLQSSADVRWHIPVPATAAATASAAATR